MVDWKEPTVQLLGRWQPGTMDTLQLFERALAKTGQVVIQVRDIEDEDNPDYETVWLGIRDKLKSLATIILNIILS